MEKFKDSNQILIKLSLPIFMELLLQLLVGNIDQIMISKYSQTSVAAVGNGNQVMNILIIVLNVISIAATILISKYIGAQAKEKISEVCNVSAFLLGTIAIIISIALILVKEQLFHWMKVSEEIIQETCNYFAVVVSCIFIQALYIAFAATLRSFSFVKEVMLISILMNTFNIIGNAVLINGLLGFPRLGIIGAAISTNISKIIGMILILIIFFRKVDVKISLRFFKPFPFKTLKRLLAIGVPAGTEELSYNLSQILILRFINIFGTTVVAAKVFCSMLANIAYVYSLAIAQAAQIVTSYLLGSRQDEKIQKRVLSTLFISWTVSISLTIIMFLNSDLILGIFTKDPAILALGRKILFIEIFLEVGRSVNITMTRSFVALGDVVFPVVLGIASGWCISVCGSYIVGVVLNFGLPGIWCVMAADEIFRGTIFLIRFRKGIWRKKVEMDRSNWFRQ